MEKEKAYNIIYDEAIRSHDITVDSIRTYDKRVHQITLLTTTSLGILFVVIGLSNFNYFSDFSSRLQSDFFVVLGYILTFIAAIFSMIFALFFCLYAYIKSKIYTLEPKKVKYGYDTLKNKKDFLGELILQIGDNCDSNSKVLKIIWDNYKRSIWSLGIGWIFLAFFIGISIYTAFVS